MSSTRMLIDRLAETFEKDRSKKSKQPDRQIDAMLSQVRMQVRVFNRVLCRVSGRKRHRDDEIGPRKTKFWGVTIS